MKFKVNNWRTSLTGILAGISVAAPEINKCIQGAECDVPHIVLGVLLAVLGAQAKDKNVTGGSKPQTLEATERADSPLK